MFEFVRKFDRARIVVIGWIAAAWPMFFVLVDWVQVPAYNTVPLNSWITEVLGTAKKGDAFRAATSSTFVVAALAGEDGVDLVAHPGSAQRDRVRGEAGGTAELHLHQGHVKRLGTFLLHLVVIQLRIVADDDLKPGRGELVQPLVIIGFTVLAVANGDLVGGVLAAAGGIGHDREQHEQRKPANRLTHHR